MSQIVWTDHSSTLLTFEDRRIIDDERLSVERPFTKDWNLHIRRVQYKDQGVYSCQINTVPVKIKTVNLRVEGERLPCLRLLAHAWISLKLFYH